MRLVTPALLLFVLSASVIARAQGDGAPFLPRSACLDSIQTTEMKRTVVYASVELPDSSDELFRPDVENFLQSVVNHVPAVLGKPPGVLPHAEPSATWQGLGASLSATAFRSGALIWNVPAQRSDTSAAALIGRALAAARADSDWVMWPDHATKDSVRFRIALQWPTVDHLGALHFPTPRHAAVPVFSVLHPVADAVAPKRGNIHPRYPDGPLREGYEATVLLQFIVDTNGRAVAPTIRDLWPAGKPRLEGGRARVYREFSDAAQRAVEKMAFEPARIGGCRVPQLVQMPFEFSLRLQ